MGAAGCLACSAFLSAAPNPDRPPRCRRRDRPPGDGGWRLPDAFELALDGEERRHHAIAMVERRLHLTTSSRGERDSDSTRR